MIFRHTEKLERLVCQVNVVYNNTVEFINRYLLKGMYTFQVSVNVAPNWESYSPLPSLLTPPSQQTFTSGAYVNPLQTQYVPNGYLQQTLPVTPFANELQHTSPTINSYLGQSLLATPPPSPAAISLLKESIRSDILQKLNHSVVVNNSTSVRTSNFIGSPISATNTMNNRSFHTNSVNNYVSQLGKRGRFNSYDSANIKKARTSSFDNRGQREPIIVSPMANHMHLSGGLQETSNSIWQYFLQNQQSEEMFQKKILLRKCLYAVLQGVFPYCGLYIVGSSMNGFGNLRSDMDLCLMVSNKVVDQKKEATEILFSIHKALRKCSFINNAQVIRAKVPIMKFKDRFSTVDCDLNINNSVGIRNTHLLKYYACLDWRVRPLMLFVKHWARFHDINDASKTTISSYSFGLMLIHFLQAGCNPPVLPSLHKLHPEMFSSTSDIRQLKLNESLKFETKNNESLGELFLGFLDYYSNKFDYDNFAISVRLGSKLPKRIIAQQTDNVRQWKYICIEEPFDLSNTARAVYDDYAYMRIRRVIRVSYHKLYQKRDVSAILTHPF